MKCSVRRRVVPSWSTSMSKFSVVKSTGDIGQEKIALRVRMKQKRAEVVNRDLKENAIIVRVEELLESRAKNGVNDERIFVYLSYSSEAPTDKLIERLILLGKEVFCPRIEEKEMVSVPYGEDFSLTKNGIREPIGEAVECPPDLIIAPLLAVDEQGNRLGYGGGYYDRFLNRCAQNAKKRPYYVGYAFDTQYIKTVPVQASDVPLDCLVTEERTVYFNNGRKKE